MNLTRSAHPVANHRLSAIAPSKPAVVLTHGENGPRGILAQAVQKRFNLKTFLPDLNEVIFL